MALRADRDRGESRTVPSRSRAVPHGRGSRRHLAQRACSGRSCASPRARRPPASKPRRAARVERHRGTAVDHDDDRGASSAKRWRTTNCSSARAVERRALARQSTSRSGRPARTAASRRCPVPRPRRMLRVAPNGIPVSRWRGTSGNVPSRRTGTLRSGRGHRPVRPRAAARARSTVSRSCSSARSLERWRLSATNVGLRTSLWPSTGTNSCSTSYGRTWSRSWRRAQARAVLASASDPRTDAPTSTPSSRASGGRAGRSTPRADRRGRRLRRRGAGRRLVDREDRPKGVDGMTVPLLPHHLELRLLSRVAEARAEEEAIELRFGEREGSLVLDRVLRGDQQKRLGQLAGDTVDRDLALAHRLEQGRLGLRRGAVDLVDEDDVREERARDGTRKCGAPGRTRRAPSRRWAGDPACTGCVRTERPRRSRRSPARGSSSPCRGRPRGGRGPRTGARTGPAGSPRSCRGRPSRCSQASGARARGHARNPARSTASSSATSSAAPTLGTGGEWPRYHCSRRGTVARHGMEVRG